MAAVWIAGGLAVIGAIIGVIAALPRRSRTELGSVSTHWISEHRLGSSHDSRR